MLYNGELASASHTVSFKEANFEGKLPRNADFRYQ
jgi:hypothetical protein